MTESADDPPRSKSTGSEGSDALRPWRPRRLVLPLLVAGAVTLITVNEVGHSDALTRIGTGDEVLAARAEVQALERLVLDAETSQRAYLLTAQPAFREQVDRASAALPEQLRRVRLLYEDRPARTEHLQALQELALRRMSELTTVMEMFEQGHVDRAQDLMQAGLGVDFMRALEADLQALALLDQRRLQASRESLRRSLAISRAGIALLVLLSLLGLALYLHESSRLELAREQRARELLAEQDRLEAEVARRTEELTELATHLQTVREDERSHLARELHDELGGLLTAAKLDLARLRVRLAAAEPEATERLQHLGKMLDAGIALKRRIIEDLRPSMLADLGLPSTLQVLCDEFAGGSGLKVHTTLADLRLSEGHQLTAYRVVQEALTNIAKYAQAREVHVTLAEDGQLARLQVRDDGVGFDPNRVSRRARGLAGMRFRVESGGGTLSLDSAPGHGVTLIARLPLTR
jgi:signal transduction histidine kinase